MSFTWTSYDAAHSKSQRLNANVAQEFKSNIDTLDDRAVCNIDNLSDNAWNDSNVLTANDKSDKSWHCSTLRWWYYSYKFHSADATARTARDSLVRLDNCETNWNDNRIAKWWIQGGGNKLVHYDPAREPEYFYNGGDCTQNTIGCLNVCSSVFNTHYKPHDEMVNSLDWNNEKGAWKSDVFSGENEVY